MKNPACPVILNEREESRCECGFDIADEPFVGPGASHDSSSLGMISLMARDASLRSNMTEGTDFHGREGKHGLAKPLAIVFHGQAREGLSMPPRIGIMDSRYSA